MREGSGVIVLFCNWYWTRWGRGGRGKWVGRWGVFFFFPSFFSGNLVRLLFAIYGEGRGGGGGGMKCLLAYSTLCRYSTGGK